MTKTVKRPRRNADKDLSKLVSIFEKLEFEDFVEMFKLFESYRDKTSYLRVMRLLYDALSIGRARQVKALAPILAREADLVKSATPAVEKLSTTRFKNGVTPARLLKRRFPVETLQTKDESSAPDTSLAERMALGTLIMSMKK